MTTRLTTWFNVTRRMPGTNRYYATYLGGDGIGEGIVGQEYIVTMLSSKAGALDAPNPPFHTQEQTLINTGNARAKLKGTSTTNGKKSTAKKSAAKKSGPSGSAKKGTIKKATAQKSSTKNVGLKKSTAKKASAKKTAATKSSAKRSRRP